jgi:hypothetical protein
MNNDTLSCTQVTNCILAIGGVAENATRQLSQSFLHDNTTYKVVNLCYNLLVFSATLGASMYALRKIQNVLSTSEQEQVKIEGEGLLLSVELQEMGQAKSERTEEVEGRTSPTKPTDQEDEITVLRREPAGISSDESRTLPVCSRTLEYQQIDNFLTVQEVECTNADFNPGMVACALGITIVTQLIFNLIQFTTGFSINFFDYESFRARITRCTAFESSYCTVDVISGCVKGCIDLFIIDLKGLYNDIPFDLGTWNIIHGGLALVTTVSIYVSNRCFQSANNDRLRRAMEGENNENTPKVYRFTYLLGSIAILSVVQIFYGIYQIMASNQFNQPQVVGKQLNNCFVS